mgnify:CR=1 FL=1
MSRRFSGEVVKPWIVRGVIRRSKVFASPAVIPNGSILWSKLVYQISSGHILVRGISIRFIALSSISSAGTTYTDDLVTRDARMRVPQKLRTTQMWRANINLFPVECYRATAEFNRVWQLVVSQLVNGEVKTTPVCSSCPMSSFLCFPPTVHRPPRLASSLPPSCTRFLLTPFVFLPLPFLLLCDS